MAKTALNIASAALALGDGTAQAGIETARATTYVGLRVAQAATGFGLGVAAGCVRLPAALLELLGSSSLPTALRRAESALNKANRASNSSLDAALQRVNVSLSRARQVSTKSLSSARDRIGSSAAQQGLYLRIFLGSEVQEFVLAAAALVRDFAAPIADVPKMGLLQAAKAWAALQQAVAAQRISEEASRLRSGAFAETIPECSERYMRFAVAAFGAFKAGALLDDSGAARRERRSARRAVLFGNAQETNHDWNSEDNQVDDDSENSPTDDEHTQNLELTEDEGNELRDGEGSVSAFFAHGGLGRPLRIARVIEKERLHALRAQARASHKAAREEKKQAMKIAREQGRESLRRARDYWRSPEGRGSMALKCAGISLESVEVIHFDEAKRPQHGEPHVPGQLVAVDNASRCVAVVLRGSSCLRDVLMDLDCKPEAVVFKGRAGLAHAGMLKAARALEERLVDAIETGLEKLSGPQKVLICGHSLGAGVAALLTELLLDSGRLGHASLQCLAFACPQVLDAKLAKHAEGHTVSIIVGDDCVPCLSLATAGDLRNALSCLQNPANFGLPPSIGSSSVLAAAALGDTAQLLESYAVVRQAIGQESERLYPAGDLIHLVPGLKPRRVEAAAVEELFLTRDMVSAHLPRRYLAAVQAAREPVIQSSL
eukprot:TRINITY_DN76164_c0_g1_i1.p1 TRINITY_DN76164_c0_g1~~TRINITY_DN76164_c0_g1_i1.p1  ORF type:complete len:661 (-),score=125.97 TRINITY_DN76164_c0_g1_i1:73-2055(-)